MTVVAPRTKPSRFIPAPGDVVRLGALEMLVVEAGNLVHSGGYGPVEMRAVSLFGGPSADGTMISTPWGMVEIVSARDPRYAAAVGGPCKKTVAATGQTRRRLTGMGSD